MGQTRAAVRRLAQSGRPILVGPWLSEIGFEVLYWIPFLHRALQKQGIDPDRLWVVSRGGCRSWYRSLTSHYVELYDLYSPAALHRRNRERIAEQAKQGLAVGLRRGQITAKQFYLSSFEQEIVRRVTEQAQLVDPVLLHPSLMYQAFRPLWKQHLRDLFPAWQALTQLRPMTAPARLVGCPARYLAVKFYASEATPDGAVERAQVEALVLALAKQIDVILLHTGTAYDEHGEFPMPEHPRIHRPTFPPAQNLDLQTAILAHAVGAVGTYGGFAYLAPCLRVPSLSFYVHRNFRRDHWRLMSDVARRNLTIPFQTALLQDGLTAVRQSRRQWLSDAA